MGTSALEARLAKGSTRAERDRLLALAAFDAIWERDLGAGTFRWTAGLPMFGYSPEQIFDESSWWTDRLHPDDRGRVLAELEAALRGSSTWASDYRFRRAEGSWAWIAMRGLIDRNAAGKASFAVGAMIDVSRTQELEEESERASAERRLRETQRMLLDAQRIGQVRAWEDDLRTGLVKTDVTLPGGSAQPAYEARPKEEAWSSIHPDDLARLMAMRQRTIETGGPFETEHRLLLPGGGERIMLVRGELVRDAAGKPERILGTSLDITERKRAEEELRKSQQLLKLVLDTLPVGVMVCDRAGNVVLANAAVSQVWGTLIAAGRERWQRSAGTWRETGKPVEEWASVRALEQGQTSLNELIDIDAFDGKRKTIQNSAAPIRDSEQAIIGAVIVNEDVTERVRAETELRKNRQQLVDAQRLAKVGSWEREVKSGAFELSEEARHIFLGDAPGELRTYDQFLACIHPGDLERVYAFRDQYLKGGPQSEIEFRIVQPDGAVRSILGFVEVVRGAGGEPIRVRGTYLDVTERKRGEEELERRLRQQAAVAQLGQSALRGGELQPLLEEAVELIAKSSDLDFADAAELLPDDTLVLRAARGWKEGVVGKLRLPAGTGSLCAFVIVSNAPGVVEDIRQETRFAVEPSIREQGIVSHMTVLIKGEARPFGTLGGGSRAPRVYTQHDINFIQSMANLLAAAVERDRGAQQLREQRQQLQALSRKLIAAQEAERRAVARELHDDFGQVLTAIKLNLQRRERDTTESIALVDGAIARMHDLVQDLRPPLLDELGLESSLRWYANREAGRAGLELRLSLATLGSRPSPQIETTCFRVAQEALTNIIRHAQARRVEIELRLDGPELLLEVRDDGQGFDVAEARKRAVHGASQGLLSMQERVALVGGSLEIQSAKGHGTIVRARLPLNQGGGP